MTMYQIARETYVKKVLANTTADNNNDTPCNGTSSPPSSPNNTASNSSTGAVHPNESATTLTTETSTRTRIIQGRMPSIRPLQRSSSDLTQGSEEHSSSRPTISTVQRTSGRSTTSSTSVEGLTPFEDEMTPSSDTRRSHVSFAVLPEVINSRLDRNVGVGISSIPVPVRPTTDRDSTLVSELTGEKTEQWCRCCSDELFQKPWFLACMLAAFLLLGAGIGAIIVLAVKGR
jgi:hypothetical protein